MTEVLLSAHQLVFLFNVAVAVALACGAALLGGRLGRLERLLRDQALGELDELVTVLAVPCTHGDLERQ